MGKVYLAEQREPLRRLVALKILRDGLDHEEVLARFEFERRAMALLGHPGIASILDAGKTEDGRPYFAMEYVNGPPITSYCDEARLSIAERIRLFTRVCDAVLHAHQKGVIHRDLKPSNILVATDGDSPTPKVIDFGIAKLLSLDDSLDLTRLGDQVGTPQYMSPEQAIGRSREVDTRSDVYSLGTLLYELLVGALPFEASGAGVSSTEEIARRIREDDALRPSLHAARLGVAAAQASRARATDPSGLVRRLRGDLDWILLKSLEKSPDRRYATPGELAADLNRHLSSEPVLARPPSRIYRLGRFTRRHAVGASVLSLVFAFLLSTAVQATLSARRLALERDRSDREAAVANEVTEFLVELFRRADLRHSSDDLAAARRMLERGAQKVQDEIAVDSPVRPRILTTMGEAFLSLGSIGEAQKLAREALEQFKADPALDDLDRARALVLSANVDLRNDELDEAKAQFETALRIRRGGLGDKDPLVADVLADLGDVHYYLDDPETAKANYLEALAIRIAHHGRNHKLVGRTLTDLGDLAYVNGDVRGAVRNYGEALSVLEQAVGQEHVYLLPVLNNLGGLLLDLRKLDSAAPLVSKALELSEKTQGREHPDLIGPLISKGRLHALRGQFVQSLLLAREALSLAEKNLPPDHSDRALCLELLGEVRLGQGELVEAYDLLQEARRIQIDRAGADSAEVARVLLKIARLHAARSELVPAEQAFAKAVSTFEQTYGPQDPELAAALEQHARFLREQGEATRASSMERRAAAIWALYADLP